jgi:hypothetical protein
LVLGSPLGLSSYQAAEKRPSAALPLSFVIAAYIQVPLIPQEEFILSLSKEAPPQTGFRKAQLASACLRVAASAEAGAFLISPKKLTFPANF